MGVIVKESDINDREFVVFENSFITTKELKYKDITVPKNYKFDGVTVWIPFTVFFRSKDFVRGIWAACFHDWLCDNRKNYKMTYATNILIELWKEKGLSSFQAFLVKISVNTYQFFKGGWKK